MVLIGAATAKRKWIDYEIEKAWTDGKGVVGIYIHNLKHKDGTTNQKGSNPFAHFTLGNATMSSIITSYDPPYSLYKSAYDLISENLGTLVEEAIKIRGRYD